MSICIKCKREKPLSFVVKITILKKHLTMQTIFAYYQIVLSAREIY